MRIAAIRGRNLASLAGEFAVELEREPIASSGVFLISGPVGAGKSTLLDTMCLALFDRTPRLARGSRTLRIADGQDEIGVTDPRSLLRRGCAEGHAEVEFIGRGGKRWCARWEVRRARDRADGRMQAQAMSLRDVVSGTVIAGNKTEVLDRIVVELGLSYDQFCRSVLLAQNEFAAFLNAKPTDRAELLERMTGTEVYALLGKAAHERAAGERNELERLEARRSAVTALPETERAALDEQAARHASRVEELRRERGSLEGVLRAVEALTGARSRRSALESAVSAAATRAAAAARRVLEAVGLRDGATRARAEAVPELRRARQLDAALEGAERERERADRAYEERAQAAALRRKELGDHEQAVAGQQALASEARRWLEAHPAVAAIAGEWPRWEAEIRAWRRAFGALAKAGQHQEAAAARLAEAERRRSLAQEAVIAAGARVAQAAEALAEARVAAGGELSSVEAERERREGATKSLARLVGLAARAAELRRSMEEAADERSAMARLRESSGAVASAAGAEGELAAALAGEAERALLRLEAAEALAPRRPELLVEGEACPLCGSAEHPHAEIDGGALSDLLREQRERVVALRERWAERTKVAEAARTRAAGATENERTAEGRLRKAEEGLAAVEPEWAAIREELAAEEAEFQDLPERPDAEGDTIVRTLEAANAARLERVRAAASALRAATTAADLASQAQIAAGTRQVDADAALVDAQAAARDAEAPIAGHGAELERAQQALTAVFGAGGLWAEELRADPEVFERQQTAVVQAWGARQAQLVLAEAELGRAEVDQRHLMQRLAEAEAAMRDAAKLRDASQALHEEAIADRAQALGGRAADAVEAELEAAAERARAAHDAAAQEEAAARAALASAEGSLATASAEVEAADQALSQALGGRDVVGVEEAPIRLAALAIEEHEAREARVQAAARVHHDDQARAALAAILPEIEKARARSDKWGALAQVIGSADGAKFRVFAQGLTLDTLVTHANEHLRQLADRYRLARVPGQDLELQVIDRAMGSEPRGVNSLSGGETFLASLALALGLSSLASQQVRVQSLFIDEGFGTLDPDTLEAALAVLDELQSTGRQIGLISHVPHLGERFNVRVEVAPQGAGRAAVRTVAA